MNFKDDVEAVNALRDKYKVLTKEIGKVIIGQDKIVEDEEKTKLIKKTEDLSLIHI